MRSYKICMAAALAALCINAHAAVETISITSGQFTPIQPPNTVTFDSAIPSDIYYSSTEIVQGTVAGVYVTPAYDTTQYLRTVDTPTVITFAGGGATYFGFYLGSSDVENTVTAYGSDGSVTTWNGQQLWELKEGSYQDSFYVNLWSTSGTTFTSIVLSSDVTPMETDNHAYILASVPEPETYAMLLGGLALIGAVSRRRRRS